MEQKPSQLDHSKLILKKMHVILSLQLCICKLWVRGLGYLQKCICKITAVDEAKLARLFNSVSLYQWRSFSLSSSKPNCNSGPWNFIKIFSRKECWANRGKGKMTLQVFVVLHSTQCLPCHWELVLSQRLTLWSFKRNCEESKSKR